MFVLLPRAAAAPQSLRAAWLAPLGLSAVFLFEMLDNSVLDVALPTIGRDLQASTSALQWVTGAYAVVFGGLMLAFGALVDRFGRRRMMLVGLVGSWYWWLAARSSIRSCNGLASTGPHGSVPRRSCSGSPSTLC